jgi:hypothetical protein
MMNLTQFVISLFLSIIVAFGFLLIEKKEEVNTPIIETEAPSIKMLICPIYNSTGDTIGEVKANLAFDISDNVIELFNFDIKTKSDRITGLHCFYNKNEQVLQFTDGFVMYNKNQRMFAKSGSMNMADKSLRNLKEVKLYDMDKRKN